jgi:hypothetical protein
MEYLSFWEIKSFPAMILVSPEGRSLVIQISIQHFKETVWSALESVVSSPKREEILQHIVKAYCVVLLIQGKEVTENKRAEKAIAGAIENITKMMSQMPKQVKEPPRLILIHPELFSKEKILLWSLGVNENETSEAHVAVLYGKGRRIGALLKGASITESEVFNILSVIGSACECGLDKGWTLGVMLPLRWGEKLQAEVMKLIGFDAESPMVKTEVSQILSLGKATKGQRMDEETVASLRDKFHGYREEVVEFESTPTVTTVPLSQFRESASTESGSSGTGLIFKVALLAVGGMFLLILAVSVFIILRARRRASY